ncbi:hypothetical protein MHYP_G00036380 [Metynnis hypsauchen]
MAGEGFSVVMGKGVCVSTRIRGSRANRTFLLSSRCHVAAALRSLQSVRAPTPEALANGKRGMGAEREGRGMQRGHRGELEWSE